MLSPMLIVGIDPGVSGAMALTLDGTAQDYLDMPTLKVGKGTVLDGPRIRDILEEWGPRLVVIEKAQAMPGQGVASTAGYMKGAGIIEGICIGLRLPYTLVHPATWKRAMLSDMDKGKGASVLKVKQLFPKIKMDRKKDHGVCDALLLALYGQREERSAKK